LGNVCLGEVQARERSKRNDCGASLEFPFPFFRILLLFFTVTSHARKFMRKTDEQPSGKKRKVNHSRKTMVTRETYHCQVRAIRELKLESSSATTAPSSSSPPSCSSTALSPFPFPFPSAFSSSSSVLTRAISRGVNSFEKTHESQSMRHLGVYRLDDFAGRRNKKIL